MENKLSRCMVDVFDFSLKTKIINIPFIEMLEKLRSKDCFMLKNNLAIFVNESKNNRFYVEGKLLYSKDF